MGLAIGMLDKKVTFKKNNRGSLGAGKTDGYTSFLTTFCSLKKLSHVQGAEMGEVIIVSHYSLICRFQTSLLDNLNGSCIAEIDGKNYIIEDIELIDEKKHFYKFIVNKQSK